MADELEVQQEQGEEQQGFLGFVLLKEAQWSKQAFLTRLKEDWGLEIEDTPDEEDVENGSILFAEYQGMRVIASLMDVPVPDGEAEHYAAANYLWPEAVEVVKEHRAQLLITVLGDEASPIERGMLFSALVANALAEDNALAVYSDGMVYEPDFYQDVVRTAYEEQDLPLLVWVWFGFNSNEEGQLGFYTYGLRKFGKEEMEVYSDHSLEEVRALIYNISHYVISSDVVLGDGETIGMSEEQKLAITRSAGIGLEGETLKIAF